MKKIILRANLSLGDIVCFSAVPRELATQYTGKFEVAVDTPFPDLFTHNPYIVQLPDDATEGETDVFPGLPDSEPPHSQLGHYKTRGEFTIIDCHYDQDRIYSVHKSNQHNVSLLESYCQDVANSLGLPSLYPRTRTGDIHLSRDEYGAMSMPHRLANVQRYWIVLAGGKLDAPVKWWPAENYQRVIDYFRGRIQFVQIGMTGPTHYQPKLNGVIDLIDQTNVRQLIHTMHAACGVLCGITSAMHLAAAVPIPNWQKRPRPCVVVAGGREPRSWYGYTTHRILDTVGTLKCCAEGGCWNAHVVPITGQPTDRLCSRVVNMAPSCMNLITPEMAINAISQYLESETNE